MNTVEDLLKEATLLPLDQQLTLAHRILSAGDPAPSEQLELAWDDTIRERIARYDQGASLARPAGEALEELARKLRA